MKSTLKIFGLLCIFLVAQPGHSRGMLFDVVIAGGRVIDPETKLDAVLNVGIKNGLITSISEKPLTGKREIDATGHHGWKIHSQDSR